MLVSPAGRKRRLLVIEGAPGFEHSFMARALAADPGLEVDTVVRKGKNDDGQDTFFVQAGGGRAAALTGGFPASAKRCSPTTRSSSPTSRATSSRARSCAMAADFVVERGGGLLVLGGRSFAQRGLIGTPLEEVLPRRAERPARRPGRARR